YVRRAFKYRHTVRIQPGLRRGNRAAEETAGPAARVSRAAGSVISNDLARLLPGADDGAAAADLGSVRTLAGGRIGDLFSVRKKKERAGDAGAIGHATSVASAAGRSTAPLQTDSRHPRCGPGN